MIDPEPWQVASGVVLLALLGMSGLLVMDRQARPRSLPLSHRPPGAIVAAVGLWLLVFGVLLLALGRGITAMAAGLFVIAALVVVNNAKESLLREPLLFDDYDYLLDTLKHPRLFLPFLGTWRLLAVAAAVALSLAMVASLEPAWTRSPAGIAAALAVLVLGAAGVARHAMAAGGTARATPRRTIRRHGLFALLVAGLRRPWMHGGADEPEAGPQRQQRWPGWIESPSSQAVLPHLVAVQSESFIDLRRRVPGVKDDLLTHFDALAAEGVSGPLRVPAFGANTVRSEYAFLSGMSGAELGMRRYNPYRYVRPGCLDRTFVQALKAAGYQTLCLHPYHARFYARDRVMPLLGFDEFVDIDAFPATAGIDAQSVYISDAVLGDRVAQRLADAEEPLFIFVITMENHGPLHLESPFTGESARYVDHDAASAIDDDVVVYLRHLRHADQMLGRLSATLNDVERGGVLCWYGDHPPILPGAWATVGYPGRWTDYLVWSSRAGSVGTTGRRATCLHELGWRFLSHAGSRN